MLTQLAYTPLLGGTLVLWLGIINLLVLLLTAMSPKLAWRGKRIFSFKWHVRLAYAAIAVSVLHGLLGLAPHVGL